MEALTRSSEIQRENFERQRQYIKDTQAKYCHLLNAVHEVYFSADVDGNLTGISPSITTIAGYNCEEIIGFPAMFFCKHQEDRDCFLDRLEKEGLVSEYQLELVHNDGQKVYVSATAHKLFNDKNEFIGVEGMLRDVSDRVALEFELRNLNHKLALMGAERSSDLQRNFQQLRKSDEALQRSHMRLIRSLECTISSIASAEEARDPYTAGHQRRVAEIAVAISREMGLSKAQVEGIHMGATVHDIGKINLPSEILSKPTKLSEIEFSLIKSHPQVGYDILSDIEFPWPVAEITLQHHERLDGSGYPQGLKGDEICLDASIVAVADIVEAMASHRPYRPSLGIEAALAEIQSLKGRQLHCDVVNACLSLFKSENGNRPFVFSRTPTVI